MKTRSIVFSDLMIDAIKLGIKSQTRRVIKQKHIGDLHPQVAGSDSEKPIIMPAEPEQASMLGWLLANSPYGKVGDRLTCNDLILEITDLRIQRVRDISARDAVREGLHTLPASGRYCLQPGMQYFGEASHDSREVFSWLWDDINGDGSWNQNPWVFVIEFQRVTGSTSVKGGEA
ncbi:hypothetical protein [Atlantibacter hermannii]|uniref:hypothetical protein n=1 Tax=Atlantibacter hermannii TaxID=565 RepID=UPI00289F2E64|nr:hypothetical protein [Atlantibacter hermannii]